MTPRISSGHQFWFPATTWPRALTIGVAASTAGHSAAMASASAALQRGDAARSPCARRRPSGCRGWTMSTLVPMLWNCSCTIRPADWQIDTSRMTAATPMTMPSTVRPARILFFARARSATRRISRGSWPSHMGGGGGGEDFFAAAARPCVPTTTSWPSARSPETSSVDALVAQAGDDLDGRQQAVLDDPDVVPLAVAARGRGPSAWPAAGRRRRTCPRRSPGRRRGPARAWDGIASAALGTVSTPACFSIWNDRLAVMPGSSFSRRWPTPRPPCR